jgi:hypothetical protein
VGGGSGAVGGGSGAMGGGSGAMGGGSGAMGGGSGAMGGGTSSGYSCTTGTLFAGNPVNMDPMARPTDGTMLLTDPPFPYRNIVFSNGQIITHDGLEIWRASLSDSKLHKIAGIELPTTGQALITGACAQAQFANIFGIALASDGSLFVSDQTANTILKITHPLDSTTCSVAHWAGTNMDIPDDGTITPANPPNVGNMDGPGAMAMFGLPERLAIDGSDNLYVWDNGNNSIRKIANDANHTVSTLVMNLVTGGAASVSEAFLNGNLYVWGNDGSAVFLNKVNPTTGASTTILSGGADKFGGGSSDALTVGGINVAGSQLVVFFNGQLFAITEAGVVSAPLAGVYQPGLDFSMGYDPAASHPAASVELVSSPSTDATAGLEAFVAVDSSHNLYVTAVDTNNYVEKIACSP